MRSTALKAISVVALALTAWTLILLAQYTLSLGTTRRHHVESIVLILAFVWLLRMALLRAGVDRTDTPVGNEWIALVVAAAASVALYWQTLSLGFLSDDFVLAEWARHGEFVSSQHVFVRPVPLLLWRALFDVGLGASAIHFCNVLLHGANTGLVFLLARRLGLDRLVGAIAALLFLVWPTQVESVAWASSMSDVLMTTMVLVATVTFIRLGSVKSIQLAAAVVIASALALLTKETAIALPAILFAVALARWKSRPRTRYEVVALLAVSSMTAVYAAWRVLVRPDVAGVIRPSVTRYVLKEQLARTFGNLAVPVTSDAAITPVWMGLVFGSIAVLLIVWANLGDDRRRQSHRIMLALAAWCLFATIPAIGYFFVGDHLEGSRYLYLAMAGWAGLIGASWQTSAVRRGWMRPVGGVVLSFLGVLAIQQSLALLSMWRTAAAQRDVLLARAHEAAQHNACGAVAVSNLPDQYLGAQLFRNGFDEAFRSTGGQTNGAARCELIWNGTDFRSK